MTSTGKPGEKQWATSQAAIDRFNRCSAAVKNTKSTGSDEAAYGAAYQALVRLGLAPQIRRKYR